MRTQSQFDFPANVPADLSESRIQHRLEGHQEPIVCVALSRNDETLASGSLDGTVLVWSVAKRTVLQTLKAHADTVTALSFSISAKLLASSGRDGKVHVWATPYGSDGQRPIATVPYSAAGKAALACKFGGTRNVLVVAGQDCSAVVYAWEQGGRPLPAASPSLRPSPHPSAREHRGSGSERSHSHSHPSMALAANWECGWNWPEGPERRGVEGDGDAPLSPPPPVETSAEEQCPVGEGHPDGRQHSDPTPLFPEGVPDAGDIDDDPVLASSPWLTVASDVPTIDVCGASVSPHPAS
eukprot:EG_transcript_11867